MSQIGLLTLVWLPWVIVLILLVNRQCVWAVSALFSILMWCFAAGLSFFDIHLGLPEFAFKAVFGVASLLPWLWPVSLVKARITHPLAVMALVVIAAISITEDSWWLLLLATVQISIMLGQVLAGWRKRQALTESVKFPVTALLDDVTNLPNKLCLQQRIVQWQSVGVNGQFSVVVLKLGSLAELNQVLGYDYVNLVLAQWARRCEQVLTHPSVVNLTLAEMTPQKLVALNNLTFMFVLDEQADEFLAARLYKDIRQLCKEPLLIEGSSFSFAVQGVHLPRGPELNLDMWLQRAFTSFVEDPDQQELISYQTELDRTHLSRVALLTEFKNALNLKQLEINAQPIVAVSDQRVEAFELLVRWRHPKHGLIKPAQFIRLAEQTGTIFPLTLWMLDRAFMVLDELRNFDVKIHVNIEASDLLQEELFEHIENGLKRLELPTYRLTLEVKEKMFMQQFGEQVMMIKRLRKLGVNIALDNFGAGLSPLHLVSSLPLSYLKLDGNLLKQALKSESKVGVMSALIDVCNQNNIKAIAEEVEDPQAVAVLKKLNCPFAQGFIYSQPIAAEGVRHWLESRIAVQQ